MGLMLGLSPPEGPSDPEEVVVMYGVPLRKAGWLSLVVLGWGASCRGLGIDRLLGRTELRLSRKNGAELTAMNETTDFCHVNVATKDWFLIPENKAKKLTPTGGLKPKGKMTFD